MKSASAIPAAGSGRIASDGLLFVGLGLFCLFISRFVAPEDWKPLGALCLSGLALAGLRMRRLFSRGQDRIVSNVFLTFTLSFSLFFLFGPLLHVFGPKADSEYVRAWFPVNAAQAVYLLGADMIGFGIAVYTGDAIRLKFVSRALEARFRILPKMNYKSVALLFLAVGLGFKMYVLYSDLFERKTISGLFRIVGQLAPAGIFLYAYKTEMKFRPFALAVVAAAAIYALGGVLEFSKTETFLPVLALMGGILARKVSLLRLAVSGVLMGVALVVMQPLNLDARNEALKRITPSFSERIDIFRGALAGDYRIESSMGTWGRLDYTAPQRAAVSYYEAGDGGDDYLRLLWAFAPRALFPHKPIMTQASTEFTYKVKGFDTSATAVGVFINGFYNLGWFGLIAVSLMVGLILAWFRAVLEAALRADSVFLLCVGLFGHMMALLISGTFLASWLAPFVIMVYLVVCAYFAVSMIRGERVAA